MNLSPEQKKKVIETVAALLVEELREEMGGSFQGLFCVELSMAAKMTGLSKPTLRLHLPIVELSEGKHGIRLTDLNAYLEKKTVPPGKKSRGERSAA